eukprot:2691433-Alexandrium_andersonii.AAC.1
MSASLVGSEMCIRDRNNFPRSPGALRQVAKVGPGIGPTETKDIAHTVGLSNIGANAPGHEPRSRPILLQRGPGPDAPGVNLPDGGET